MGRASVPAAFGGTGFQPVRPHRQDAGATKNSSEQSFMSFRLNRELRKVPDGHITNLEPGTLNFSCFTGGPMAHKELPWFVLIIDGSGHRCQGAAPEEIS